MSFGGYNNDKHESSSPITVPYSNTRQGSYFIKVPSIVVEGSNGGNVVPYSLNDELYILDTGTTLTYLPERIYNNLMDQVKSYCQSRSDACLTLGTRILESGQTNRCYILTINGNDISQYRRVANSYPSITFSLGNTGAKLTLKPDEWLSIGSQYDGKGYVICNTFASSGNQGVNLIGNLFMRNKDILYNNDA